MERINQERVTTQQTRYEALQQVSGFIATHPDLNGVLENLCRLLSSVVSFEFLGIMPKDPERPVSRVYAFGGILTGSPEIGTEIPMTDHSAEAILAEQKPIIVSDIEEEKRFPEIVRQARSYGIRSMCIIPLPYQRE